MAVDLSKEQQDVADAIAARVREQLRVPATAVTSDDMKRVPCHCNSVDCERCRKQVAASLAEVKARHAELYPAIIEAERDAQWTARGQRESMDALHKQLAELTAAIAKLGAAHG